ncbi:hypothetical protein [Microlunatus flavus]|uniref:hypothetical protein n=1 Tax=Microlunatus flavus TaxID=1036181 RepID=UPI0011139934|nr:hypothetical protein [Microlunatus flavus]
MNDAEPNSDHYVRQPPRSRWHRVFAAALRDRPAVGVLVAVTDHLGRPPSRSEANAARRAAHSFAASGLGRLEHIQVSEAFGDHNRLVLVRSELASPSIPELLAALDGDCVDRSPADLRVAHTQSSRRLVADLVELAKQARHLQLAQLTDAERHELAARLAPALSELGKFKRQLGKIKPPAVR